MSYSLGQLLLINQPYLVNFVTLLNLFQKFLKTLVLVALNVCQTLEVCVQTYINKLKSTLKNSKRKLKFERVKKILFFYRSILNIFHFFLVSRHIIIFSTLNKMSSAQLKLTLFHR